MHEFLDLGRLVKQHPISSCFSYCITGWMVPCGPPKSWEQKNQRSTKHVTIVAKIVTQLSLSSFPLSCVTDFWCDFCDFRVPARVATRDTPCALFVVGLCEYWLRAWARILARILGADFGCGFWVRILVRIFGADLSTGCADFGRAFRTPEEAFGRRLSAHRHAKGSEASSWVGAPGFDKVAGLGCSSFPVRCLCYILCFKFCDSRR